MKKVDIKQVVKGTLGSMEAYGETTHDTHALENLEDYEDLMLGLTNDIVGQAENIKRYEYSMKKIGEKSVQILKGIKEIIDDTLKELEEVSK